MAPHKHRQMKGPAFRRPQERDVMASHFAPINELVDQLREQEHEFVPNVAPFALGIEPLHHLVALLPDVRVVMLMGLTASNAWVRLVRRHPGTQEARP